MIRSSCIIAAVLALQVSATAVAPQVSPHDADAPPTAPSGFEPPRRVVAADGPVETAAPGYAAPCHADFDGDGHADLLVGQIDEGRIKVHRGRGDGSFGEGRWLEIAGKPVSVPGVW